MGYSNYLIKVKGISGSQTASSDYTIPLDCVLEKTYTGTYSTLDMDSSRNGNGKLVRTVLPHKVAHCSIEFRPNLPSSMIGSIMNSIQARYTKPIEKKLVASIWVAELGDYVETEMYMPDIEFTVNKIENNKVIYESFTLEFIGY